MDSEVKILIVARDRPSKWKWLIRHPLFAASQVGVIGIGVWVGSDAMQWAGFALLALGFIGVALGTVFREEPMTIAEARKRLDELERR